VGFDEDKERLLTTLKAQYDAGFNVSEGDIAKAKIDLLVAEAEIRAAGAAEKNAKFMLWSTVAAALSAVGSLIAAILQVVSALPHK